MRWSTLTGAAAGPRPRAWRGARAGGPPRRAPHRSRRRAPCDRGARRCPRDGCACPAGEEVEVTRPDVVERHRLRRVRLRIGVTRDDVAELAPRVQHEARAVEAERGDAAPEVAQPEVLTRQQHCRVVAVGRRCRGAGNDGWRGDRGRCALAHGDEVGGRHPAGVAPVVLGGALPRCDDAGPAPLGAVGAHHGDRLPPEQLGLDATVQSQPPVARLVLLVVRVEGGEPGRARRRGPR